MGLVPTPEPQAPQNAPERLPLQKVDLNSQPEVSTVFTVPPKKQYPLFPAYNEKEMELRNKKMFIEEVKIPQPDYALKKEKPVFEEEQVNYQCSDYY